MLKVHCFLWLDTKEKPTGKWSSQDNSKQQNQWMARDCYGYHLLKMCKGHVRPMHSFVAPFVEWFALLHYAHEESWNVESRTSAAAAAALAKIALSKKARRELSGDRIAPSFFTSFSVGAKLDADFNDALCCLSSPLHADAFEFYKMFSSVTITFYENQHVSSRLLLLACPIQASVHFSVCTIFWNCFQLLAA